ncbi:MAG: hypothetical protein ACXWZM_07145 [Solirubrobacterales bacterium]
MAKRSLRPQLNQIRAWVRQGRTDAWIAHQLEIGTSELREFRRQHGLSPDDEDGTGEVDLRDEIEAEIAEASAAEEAEDAEDAEDAEGAEEADGASEESAGGEPEPDGEEAEGRPRRRRRRGRRGGRGRRRAELEATFEQGDDGYGLWLDPAVKDDPGFAEHWAGQREVTVRIEPDQIVIRRAGPSMAEDAGADE